MEADNTLKKISNFLETGELTPSNNDKKEKSPQNLGQSLWGLERAEYGLPKGLETALISRRALVLWVCLIGMAFAIAPGFFPQIRAFLVDADIGIKEEAVRLIIFLISSFGFTWLLDRGWRTKD